MRHRNSMASLGRLLDSQSSGERDDEDLDSVSGRPSVDHSQLTATTVRANGSVPCADNEAFDADAETTAERQDKSDESLETRYTEPVTAEVYEEASESTQPGRVRGPLSKTVSFVGFNEQAERNKENSTEHDITNEIDDSADCGAGDTKSKKKSRFPFGKNK